MKVPKSKSLTNKSHVAKKASIETIKKRRNLRNSNQNVDSLSEMFSEISFKESKSKTQSLNVVKNSSDNDMEKNNMKQNNVKQNNTNEINGVDSLIDQFGKKLDIGIVSDSDSSKNLYFNFPNKNNKSKLLSIKKDDIFPKNGEYYRHTPLLYRKRIDHPPFCSLMKSLPHTKLKNLFKIIKLNKYFIDYNLSNPINTSNGVITEIDETDGQMSE